MTCRKPAPGRPNPRKNHPGRVSKEKMKKLLILLRRSFLQQRLFVSWTQHFYSMEPRHPPVAGQIHAHQAVHHLPGRLYRVVKLIGYRPYVVFARPGAPGLTPYGFYAPIRPPGISRTHYESFILRRTMLYAQPLLVFHSAITAAALIGAHGYGDANAQNDSYGQILEWTRCGPKLCDGGRFIHDDLFFGEK